MTDLYQKAGVDITLGNTFVERIKPLIRQTYSPEVLTDIGGFSGLFQLDPAAYAEPVLVSSTDGVGTKLKIAQDLDRHNTIGIDLVAMCVNDIIVQGARPLFFLDYLATGKLDLETSMAVIEGIVQGCRTAGCALLGGETAEMPGFYPLGEYDLAGFAVGIVERKQLIDGSAIRPGDRIIGLASAGLHSNGFSLVRRVIFQDHPLDLGEFLPELGRSLGEELLTPTRIYVKPLLSLIRQYAVKGMAHITGGGITENLPRVLPQDCQARLVRNSWPVPPIFTLIQKWGKVSAEEMRQVFNNGLGMILIVPGDQAEGIMAHLNGQGEHSYAIGEVLPKGPGGETITWI